LLTLVHAGYSLRLQLGFTLQGRPVTVKTNYPLDGKPFDASRWHDLPWVEG
jgi:hypothetical protein